MPAPPHRTYFLAFVPVPHQASSSSTCPRTSQHLPSVKGPSMCSGQSLADTLAAVDEPAHPLVSSWWELHRWPVCKSECAFNGEVVRTCCSSNKQHSFTCATICPTRQTMLPYSSVPACVMYKLRVSIPWDVIELPLTDLETRRFHSEKFALVAEPKIHGDVRYS